MNDYLKFKELYHYGVKGMKWGVVKNPDQLDKTDRAIYDKFADKRQKKTYMYMPDEYRKKFNKGYSRVTRTRDDLDKEDKTVYDSLDDQNKKVYLQTSDKFRKEFNKLTPQEQEKLAYDPEHIKGMPLITIQKERVEASTDLEQSYDIGMETHERLAAKQYLNSLLASVGVITVVSIGGYMVYKAGTR